MSDADYTEGRGEGKNAARLHLRCGPGASGDGVVALGSEHRRWGECRRSHHLMALMNGREQRPFDEESEELIERESLMRICRRPNEATGYLVVGCDVLCGEYGRAGEGVHEFRVLTTDIMPEKFGPRYGFAVLISHGVQNHLAELLWEVPRWQESAGAA
jgi:hypothetical protein